MLGETSRRRGTASTVPAKLAEDPQFSPKPHIPGHRARFVFGRARQGPILARATFGKNISRRAKPYLDGYRGRFHDRTCGDVRLLRAATIASRVFAASTPRSARRACRGAGRSASTSARALGCRPFLGRLQTARRAPVRRPRGCGARWSAPRSTAWGARRQSCKNTTFLKYVGGIMRPRLEHGDA